MLSSSPNMVRLRFPISPHLFITLNAHCFVAQSVGSTSAQGAIYSAVFNVASAIGRVTFGFLADAATGVSSSRRI